MFNKKGVSPLIATVLLVMIVVSIGAAVMVVIQGLSEEQIQSIETQSDLLECGVDVEVGLVEIDSVYRFCTNLTSQTRGNVTLLMENTGQRDISGFKVTVLGDDGFNSTTYASASLTKGSLSGFSFVFGGVGDSSSEIGKVTISPQITLHDIVTCVEPNLEFDAEFLDKLNDCGSVTWNANIAATS